MEGYCRQHRVQAAALDAGDQVFVYDDSFERGQKVSNFLLDDLRSEREVATREGEGTRQARSCWRWRTTISNPYDGHYR